MKDTIKKKFTRTMIFFILFSFFITLLASCNNDNTESEDPTEQVKEVIDNLYVAGINREKSLKNIAISKEYTETGSAEKNAAGLLTDGKFASKEKTDKGWAVFDFSSEIEITIDLGRVEEGICSFSINMLQIIRERMFVPDELIVLASTDGDEFVTVGLMNRIPGDKTNLIKTFRLDLSGGIKASHIRFVAKSSKTGTAYIDETEIFMYTDEEPQNTKKEDYQFYNGKMPEKVETPVYWDESDDYNKKQNLVLGIIPSVFNMNIDIPASSNSPAEDIAKITDGVRAQSASYQDDCLFRSYSGIANTDARLFVFDLKKTSALCGFRTTFVKSTHAGVDIPESYSVYASENGVAWDVVYRRDGIRTLDASNASLVVVEDEFELKRARFVAVFFDIEGHTRFDEIEIFGTKSVEGAKPVSEKGDTKFFTGAYPQPDDVGGIHDKLLLYHCYSNDITNNNPDNVSLTEEQCLTWAAYIDREGNIKDFYFDTFHFVPGGGTETFVGAEMWRTYLNSLYKEGINLDALNRAVGTAKNALDKPDYKAKVILSIFLPSMVFEEFGDLDGDGIDEDFSKIEDKKKAIDWLLNQYIDRFSENNYEHLELAGFYWLDEVIRYKDVTLPATIRYTADKVNELGYVLTACPYYLSSGFYDFYNLGVDVVYLQPSYYFWNHTEDAIEKTATMAKFMGMGVEMEVESNATTDINNLKWYMDYLKGGVDYGYIKASHMYYHSGPYYRSCTSKSEIGRQIYELNYRFTKGTLAFTESEAVYDKVYTCKPGEDLNKKLDIKGIEYKLIASTKYGLLKFSDDGLFKYTPATGFKGEDSFYVDVMITGAEKIVYEVKINVGN